FEMRYSFVYVSFAESMLSGAIGLVEYHGVVLRRIKAHKRNKVPLITHKVAQQYRNAMLSEYPERMPDIKTELFHTFTVGFRSIGDLLIGSHQFHPAASGHSRRTGKRACDVPIGLGSHLDQPQLP